MVLRIPTVFQQAMFFVGRPRSTSPKFTGGVSVSRCASLKERRWDVNKEEVILLTGMYKIL